VEGQENRSVVICVEHPLDGPLSELGDLRGREFRSRTRSHAREEQTHSGIATGLKRIARSGDGVVDRIFGISLSVNVKTFVR